jgi:hypothetical protein
MDSRWPSWRVASRASYWRRKTARLYWRWRRFIDDPSRATDHGFADILLLPLTGLALTLLLLGTVQGASDAIAAACATACLP